MPHLSTTVLQQRRFQEAMSLFDLLCELPLTRRQERLVSLSSERPDLGALLANMLQADAASLSIGEVSLAVPEVPRPRAAPAPVGEYILEQPLGIGGMGEVWQGRHRELGTLIAMKLIRVLPPHLPKFLQDFREEARSAAKLDHPRIITLFDYGQVTEAEAGALNVAPGCPWLSMELVGGGPLTAWVRQAVSWERCRDVLVELLDALAHAHARGVVHLDIKPANILLDDSGQEGVTVRLADFGIAHAARGLMGEMLVGTPAYMAPEQQTGQWRGFGPWTDLYAVGRLAWVLLHGTLPEHDLGWKPRCAAPEGIAGWIHTLTALRPPDRFSSAAMALEALLALSPTALPVWSLARSGWRQLPVSRPLLSNAGLGLYALREVPLVGRQHTRAALWEALDAPGVIAIRGVSGVGKSRVARWLCERAVESGRARAMTLQADPVQMRGLGAVLEAELRLEGLEAGASRERAAAALSDDALAVDAMRFARPGGRPPEPARFWQVIRALLGPGQLGVMWVDDAQWSPESLRLLQALDQQEHGPLVVVLTVQEEALAEAPESQRLLSMLSPRTLSLAPLTDTEHRALIAESLRLWPALVDQIHETTSGNALFAIQLVGDWIERGWLRSTPGGFALQGQAHTMPSSLEEVWTARLDRLLAPYPPEHRRTLELAAALGQQVDDRQWQQVCQAAGLTPHPALTEAMMRAHLATPHPDGWAFVHSILRQTVIAHSQQRGAWAADNRLCAETLNDNTTRSMALRGQLARHNLAAGQRDDAFRLLEKNHDALVRQFQRVAAEALQRQIAALLEGTPPEDRLWTHYYACINNHAVSFLPGEEAEEVLQRCLRRCEEHGWPRLLIDIRFQLANNQKMALNIAGAVETLQELLKQPLTPHQKLRCKMELATMLVKRRELAAARVLIEENTRQLQEIGAVQHQSWRRNCQAMLCEISLWEGDLEAAEACTRALVAELAKSQEPHLEMINVGLVAEISLMRGDLEQMREHEARCGELAEQLSFDLFLRLLLAENRLRVGALEELHGELCALGAEFHAAGIAVMQGVLCCMQAVTAAHEGDTDTWTRSIRTLNDLLQQGYFLDHREHSLLAAGLKLPLSVAQHQALRALLEAP